MLDLENKLQQIIQEDFINEDAYGWTQYCQSMDYIHGLERDELRHELEEARKDIKKL